MLNTKQLFAQLNIYRLFLSEDSMGNAGKSLFADVAIFWLGGRMPICQGIRHIGHSEKLIESNWNYPEHITNFVERIW